MNVKTRDELGLVLKILFFKIPLYPGKEKTVKLSDYKIKKFRKRLLKESDKEENKKAKKKSSTDAKRSDKKEGDEEKPKRDIKGLISTITELVRVFLQSFGKHLHIEIKRIKIVVGSADAATTAVLYGAVCGAVQCLLELMHNCLKLKLPKSTDDVSVVPDFTSEKTDADVDITFSFRIWQLFDILIKVGIAYIKQLL